MFVINQLYFVRVISHGDVASSIKEAVSIFSLVRPKGNHEYLQDDTHDLSKSVGSGDFV